MASTRSRSGDPLAGQAPPRVRHAPSVRSNSWEDVADLSASLGVTLDEWQEATLEAAMGERADGRWAARIVGVSAPRQQGKSQLIVARALAGVLLFDEQTIICSAHQADTAREVFQRLLDVIEANSFLEKRVDSVMKAVNREHIRFSNGQVIKMKARSVSGGRGFSCDCLLLDEAQILGKPAWSSILPTMSARDNPQAWLLGTPPTPQDDGEVFSQIREQGVSGTGSRLAYVEWSADPSDDFDAAETWAKANPAYGSRISHEAIEAERSSMDDEQFALERLGIWDTRAATAAFGPGNWEACAAAEVSGLALGALGVAADRDLGRYAVLGAALDGDVVQVKPLFSGPNRADAVAFVVDMHEKHDAPVAIDGRGPAAVLIQELEQCGVVVTTLKTPDVLDACAGISTAVPEQRLRHADYPELNSAVANAKKRDVGDRWAWGRKGDDTVAQLEAATFAHWLLTRPVPEVAKSAYESGNGVMTI